jgi:hypothetical protein
MDAPPALVVDLDAFGVSRHSNHSYAWRQINPGLGITVGVPLGDIDWVASTGTYLDSYDQHARYALTGLRAIVGDRCGWHGGLTVELGYFDGSGTDGVGLLPVLQFGYDRFSLCLTGQYAQDRSSPDPKNIGTSVIALFLEVEVARF